MNIYEKLAVIQAELKAPKDMTNSFGGYRYRSNEGILKALKPHLKKHGLILTQQDEMVEVGGRVYVKATCLLMEVEFATDKNSSIKNSAYAREAIDKKKMDDSQITGAASSYARKYAMNGLFLLDDTKDADTMEYGKEGKERETEHEKSWQKYIAEQLQKQPDEVHIKDCLSRINNMKGASSYMQYAEDMAVMLIEKKFNKPEAN